MAKWYQNSILVLFAAFLLAPWCIKALVEEPWIDENKTVPEFPKSAENFPEAFDTYFSSHFGGRFFWINQYAHFKKDLMGSALHEEKITWEQDSLLLLCDYDAMRNISGTHSYAEEKLREKFKFWRWVQTEVNLRGATYIKACLPDKQTMLRQYLSNRIQLAERKTLLETIAEHQNRVDEHFKVLDMRDVFRQAQGEGIKLYLNFDTHWNSYGGFLAYQEVMKATADETGIAPLSLDDYDLEWRNNPNGDLLALAGFKPDEYWEYKPFFTPKDQKVKTIESHPDGYGCDATVHVNKGSRTDHTLLVFCDSYTIAMMPFYDQHFKRAIYLKRSMSMDAVDSIRPKLVVDSYVERYFR